MQTIKYTYPIYFLAILLGALSIPLAGQTPFDAEFAEEASGIREQIRVFTDRSIYAVDELIYFVADHQVTGPTGASPWSSVLYVELVASNGDALIQGKYRLSGGWAEGSMHVPAEMLTGNYYLKCYTRWMRNFGPGSFSYVPLKIINPFKTEVSSVPGAASEAGPVHRIRYRGGVLECSTGSDTYRTGQDISLQVNGSRVLLLDQLKCCVTVVPKGVVDLTSGQIIPVKQDQNSLFSVSMLPDLGSNISISGTVVGPDQVAVPYTTLHFSMLGEDPDYFAAMSDEQGKFIISTPASDDEYREFFVTPEQEDDEVLEVRIDQEYDSRSPGFVMEGFKLSNEEEEVARKLALNMQLSKAFISPVPDRSEPVKETVSEGERIPFYGTHVNRLYIDDYVRLPNLEEVFINLMPEVQFYRKKGKNRIRILSENNSIGVFNPLIMIDHISVFDHEALLALSPEKIERIDLINDIYLKGSVPFGGVLAIQSRKGDMAGIDLPRGSYFFDYQSFHTSLPPIDPSPDLEARIPDTRNTLFWSSALNLQKEKPLELSFRAPTSTGTYVVLVRAVLPDGQIAASSTEFHVE